MKFLCSQVCLPHDRPQPCTRQLPIRTRHDTCHRHNSTALWRAFKPSCKKPWSFTSFDETAFLMYRLLTVEGSGGKGAEENPKRYTLYPIRFMPQHFSVALELTGRNPIVGSFRGKRGIYLESFDQERDGDRRGLFCCAMAMFR